MGLEPEDGKEEREEEAKQPEENENDVVPEKPEEPEKSEEVKEPEAPEETSENKPADMEIDQWKWKVEDMAQPEPESLTKKIDEMKLQDSTEKEFEAKRVKSAEEDEPQDD